MMLEISMPSAVFDYDEIRKWVRTDYLFCRAAGRKTSGSAPATSTDGAPADLSCDWCGKGGSDAENCPYNRNTGAICATKADR